MEELVGRMVDRVCGNQTAPVLCPVRLVSQVRAVDQRSTWSSAGKVRRPVVAEEETGLMQEQETCAGREAPMKDKWDMSWTVKWEHCGQANREERSGQAHGQEIRAVRMKDVGGSGASSILISLSQTAEYCDKNILFFSRTCAQRACVTWHFLRRWQIRASK